MHDDAMPDASVNRKSLRLQTLYGWVGAPDGPGLFETRQAIIDKADHSDVAALADKYVRHEDLPGTFLSRESYAVILSVLPGDR